MAEKLIARARMGRPCDLYRDGREGFVRGHLHELPGDRFAHTGGATFTAAEVRWASRTAARIILTEEKR